MFYAALLSKLQAQGWEFQLDRYGCLGIGVLSLWVLGITCTCSMWVVPAFAFPKSKVDPILLKIDK